MSVAPLTFSTECMACDAPAVEEADWCSLHTFEVRAEKVAMARAEARRLMNMHGLILWGLEFSDEVAFLGRAVHRRRVIVLSREWAAVRPFRDTRNTILHEIAHVLMGPGHGHGDAWLARARAIGYEGGQRGVVTRSLLSPELLATCS